MQLKAYAKINLTLDVVRKLGNGYHEIESVMQQVDLHDKISLEKADETNKGNNKNKNKNNNESSNRIIIECNDKELENEHNIAFRAALLLKDKLDIKDGIKISIEKNIPVAAGLSGGSTDAAIVLRGMNDMFKLNLRDEELIKIGAEIGMDVPFSILGGTCHVRGRGELLERIDSLNGVNVVLVKHGAKVSTKEAYNGLDLEECGLKNSTKKLVDIINKKALKEIANSIYNDFELSIFRKYPEIKEIKNRLISCGALNASMSGSGPTVFGIFENEEKAKECYNKIKQDYNFVYLGKTI